MIIDIKEISLGSILTILSFIFLFAFCIFGMIKSEESDTYQIRFTTILIEAILLLLMFIFNIFIYTNEKKLGLNEVNQRAQNIIDQLKQSGMNTIQVYHIG